MIAIPHCIAWTDVTIPARIDQSIPLELYVTRPVLLQLRYEIMWRHTVRLALVTLRNYVAWQKLVALQRKVYKCFIYRAILANDSSKCSFWWVITPIGTKIAFRGKNNLSARRGIYANI